MSRVVTVSESITLVSVECNECGAIFAISGWLQENLKTNGKSFFCPNGHRLFYGLNEADKLRRELQTEKARHDQTAAALRDAMNAVAAKDKEAKRLATRIGNGVCPCCNRSFTNLRRHMKTKHPERVQGI